ncbi:MAG: putative zinc-binding protein [Planctomycetes bacterium]|nr:putative zinc-binding protein [Planctomycetota bacterium]
MESSNVCSGGDILIFACSGAADVGAVADRAAREMTKQGIGKMFCLAGIGGGIEPILKKTAEATKILAIDGCGMNCVKSCLEMAGFNQFSHLQLASIGMEKGQINATDENVNTVVAKGKEIIA